MLKNLPCVEQHLNSQSKNQSPTGPTSTHGPTYSASLQSKCLYVESNAEFSIKLLNKRGGRDFLVLSHKLFWNID